MVEQTIHKSKFENDSVFIPEIKDDGSDAAQRLASSGGRRIIICCDGTSNQPNRVNPTNVVKIARGIAPVASNGVSQLVYYDWGVGSGRGADRATGGFFGWGLQKNVEDAYRFLVHNYKPGDHVLLFGFSRGAFTARSVAGFIRKCGILRPDHDDLIKKSYDLYRNRDVGVDDSAAVNWRKDNSFPMPLIEFVGVFDTVGAMGFPAQRFAQAAKFWGGGLWKRLVTGGKPEFTGQPRPIVETKKGKRLRGRHHFHNMELSRWVKNGYQALAIDEQRPIFSPNIWDSKPKNLPKTFTSDTWDGVIPDTDDKIPGKKQKIVQAWFPGAHSDVGGNSKLHNSSTVLKWMGTAAYQQSGLEFEQDFWIQIDKDLKEDWGISFSPPAFLKIKGSWGLVGWAKRDMSGNVGGTECIHPFSFKQDEDPNLKYDINNPGNQNLKQCGESGPVSEQDSTDSD